MSCDVIGHVTALDQSESSTQLTRSAPWRWNCSRPIRCLPKICSFWLPRGAHGGEASIGKKLFMIDCSCPSEWEQMAASSAYRASHTSNAVVLVLAVRHDVENKLLSNLVLRPTPSSTSLAFCFASLNITERHIPKRVGARTQPCFTPFTTWKGSDIIPSIWAVSSSIFVEWFDKIK